MLRVGSRAGPSVPLVPAEGTRVGGPLNRRKWTLRAIRRWAVIASLASLSAGCTWLPNVFRHSASSQATRLVEQARKACQSGDHDRARQLLTRAAAIAPDEPALQCEIGRALLQSGEHDEAVKHLRYATRQGIDNPDVRLELAGALWDVGRYDECEEMIDSTLRQIPTSAPAQLMKGELAERRHSDDEALETYYRLLGMDPSDYEAGLRLADLLVRINRTSQAAPLLRSIAESDRVPAMAQARARWQLGVVYGRERRWAEAADELIAAAELRPELSANDCYQLAYAFWESGQHDRAREYVSKTLALDPRHVDGIALDTLCRTPSTAQAAYSNPPLPAPKGW